ncbi:MAG: alpha/beta fold hydrolase [Parvibaculum sp.]|nr:alpha/beta fold hydrolase [Parvibaculum sp.]
MKILRTPDACFAHVPDYPYPPHWTDIASGTGQVLRIHAVDEGPRDAAPVLLMHGEPSWSFLYRHMIAGLVAKGHRVVAPDLIGFGKSDKPSEQSDYTYERHVAWMSAWLHSAEGGYNGPVRWLCRFCHSWWYSLSNRWG